MEEAPIAEIKPDIHKAFIRNIAITSIIIILITSSLIYLNIIVGLDVFLDAFKELQINPSILLAYSIFFLIFFTALSLILNYLALGKIRYILYPNKIVYNRSFFIIHISNKTIPYKNIAKISYEKKLFFNTAKIIIELTGMGESKVEMDFIDNPEEIIIKIQELIRKYKADYYAQYSQEYRYQNIMDRF